MRFLIIAALLVIQAVPAVSQKNKSLPPIQSERFARDIHDKNVGDILSVFTPKAVIVDPRGKSVKGEEELRKLYDETTNAYDSELHLNMTSFGQTGTFGIEHGTYSETRRNKTSGVVQELHGTYVFLHEKQPNGEWLIAHQKWTEAHDR